MREYLIYSSLVSDTGKKSLQTEWWNELIKFSSSFRMNFRNFHEKNSIKNNRIQWKEPFWFILKTFKNGLFERDVSFGKEINWRRMYKIYMNRVKSPRIVSILFCSRWINSINISVRFHVCIQNESTKWSEFVRKTNRTYNNNNALHN